MVKINFAASDLCAKTDTLTTIYFMTSRMAYAQHFDQVMFESLIHFNRTIPKQATFDSRAFFLISIYISIYTIQSHLSSTIIYWMYIFVEHYKQLLAILSH